MINLKMIFLEQQIRMTLFIFIYYCVTDKVHCFWNIFSKHLSENAFQLSALKEDSVLYIKETLV